MKLEKVEFTCPECGITWIEWQSPSDEWFRLGTRQTLCANCGKEAIARIKESWKKNEDLSGWTCSDE